MEVNGIDFSLILEIKEKAKIAEDYINHNFEGKNNGHISEGLNIPSVNELRYALNHLLRYLTGEQDHGHRALKHARRAIYDCYETEGIYLFASYQQFETENQDILLINGVFPNYLVWARKFLELKEFMTNTPKDCRDDYYENLEAKILDMRAFYYESRAARQEILKIRAEKEKNEIEKKDSLVIAQENLLMAKRTIKIRTAALTLSILALLSAISGLYIQSYH